MIRRQSVEPLPIAICSVVGDVLGSCIYHHKTLENLFYEAGATGDVPDGNCVTKCQTWLKRIHTEVPSPTAFLGSLIQNFMDSENDDWDETRRAGRTSIRRVLARFGFSYHRGGEILGAANAIPTKSLRQILQDRSLATIGREFDRTLSNVEEDPPAAITAACSILESTLKVYIEDNDLQLPADQSLKPLWKIVSKNLGLDPGAKEDHDVRKILSGLNTVVDGIGSLRTHTGSAHGRGRTVYLVQSRHARLAVHASHTLVAFLIETWDERVRGG